MSSDYCIVCADPLNFTAYGPCGHKETCSKCVSRLRSVLKDQRCAYCQQQSAEVFVTHFAGDYTQQVAPEDFPNLSARAKAGELFYLASAQAYFDDKSHYDEIKALCSFTHPMAGHSRAFPSLRALSSHLQQTHKRQFCDICLDGRKVFVAEQQIYTKQELERHMRQGDEEGPMAESGFKGHPECRFCRKRFFGETELYHHMHATHEECFLCKRAHPNRHVYYRDYADLENHFKQEHYPCEHPQCLEQRFVVFPTEQELKTHTAREHGQSLSKAERKQALTLPVAFNYRRPGEDDSLPASTSASNLAAVAAGAQGAVVIGGAASVPGRLAARNRRGSAPNLGVQAAEAAAVAAATAESVADLPQSSGDPSRRAVEPQRPVLTESEFPSMVASAGAGPAYGGRWAGGAGPSGGTLSGEDFPALPGATKAAKRRAAKKSAAEIVGGGGSVRVVNVGSGRPPTPPLGQDNFPALVSAPTQPAARRDVGEWQQAGPKKGGMRRPPSSQEIAGPRPPSRESFPALEAPPGSMKAMPLPKERPEVGPSGAGGVSEALRAANRELIEKIKVRLGNDAQFAEFRKLSAAWVKGDLSSRDYHAAIAGLGLVSVVTELAATCPDAKKREELLSVHAGAFGVGSSSKGKGTWMPPEAAAAAVAHAVAHSSWACDACTLVNAPAAPVCEACGQPRPSGSNANNLWKGGKPQVAPSTPAREAAPGGPPAESFPALPSASGSGASSSGGQASGKGKAPKGRQSLSSFMTSTKAHTQNPWKNPNLKGEWAAGKAGTLAQQERALNNGWGN